MSCPHEWDLTPENARSLQRRLSERIRLQPLPDHFDVLGAADISYHKSSDRQVAVMLTFQWPQLSLLESAHVVTPVRFPYISGLLSFREAPPLLDAYHLLKRPPDLLLCDGQGIAHPRRLGLASHLGLCLNIPTVGCAKSRLCGEYTALALPRGSCSPLTLRGEVVGYVYRSRDGVNPLYISPGHLADMRTSLALIECCLGRYRIPEPLRQAHHMATRLRQDLVHKG